MREGDESSGLSAIIGPPVIVVAGLFLLHLLPNDFIAVLIVWLLASFPIGVLAGHCVLSEEQDPNWQLSK